MQFGNTESNKLCAARGEPAQLVLVTIFFTFKQHFFNRLSSRIQFHRDIAAAKHAREQKILCAGYISDQILAPARLVLATHRRRLAPQRLRFDLKHKTAAACATEAVP